MHDHISIACNSRRSTGMKLILVLFESYRVEDFFGFRKPLLIYLFDMLSISYVTKEILTHNICTRAVVPKLFRAVTQIWVTIKSYYPQCFAVIAHNIEQNCDFGSALPPEESDITPGDILPQFGNHFTKASCNNNFYSQLLFIWLT